MENKITMKALKDQMIEVLEEEVTKDCEYPEDVVSEIVEGMMPIYYSDTFKLFCSDADIAFREPENQPHELTVLGIANMNIFEILSEEADQWSSEQEKACEEEKEEEEEEEEVK